MKADMFDQVVDMGEITLMSPHLAVFLSPRNAQGVVSLTVHIVRNVGP